MPHARSVGAFVEQVGALRGGLERLGDAAFEAAVAERREALMLRPDDAAEWPAAFALVREAARRALGTAHYDVQIATGYWMANGAIAELPTGEGKTLAAVLPIAVAALAGTPVHVVSANDYLVERDARAMDPIFEMLGLSVGAVLESEDSADQRRVGYGCDIAYATTRVLAFDYLRDQLTRREGPGGTLLLRGLCCAVIDEADAVLIDQASTPLVLAARAEGVEERRARRRALWLASRLRHGRDFRVDPVARSVALSDGGRAALEALAKTLDGPWRGPRRRERWVEQALRALYAFRRNRDYVVVEGAVHIVDPDTGRAAPERSWERGLHQLIELKEGCAPTPSHETLARISVQRFYRRYLRLCGTTGTACEATGELRASYGLATRIVPARLPERRTSLGARVFPEARCKWTAVVDRVRELRGAGRPVLVGTGSVAASEHLGTLLRGCGVPHRVLNALQDEGEAEIVAAAGRPSCVTVATQLAGRGTDIELDRESRAAGGLHVIATHCGEPARLDRQLVGRCARQGDPGSFEYIHSLDDEAVVAQLSPALRRWAVTRGSAGGALPARLGQWLTWLVRRAEEGRRRHQRRDLLAHEDELEQVLAFSGRGD